MKHSQSALAGFLVATLIAVGCGGGGGSSPTSPGNSLVEVENGSFQLVNAERQEKSVSPRLGGDPALAAIAREHSEAMRDEGFFSHTSPSGVSLRERLRAEGYSYVTAGENIARVTNAGNPASYAHSLLMQNPTHRENILSTKYKRLGVGVARQGDTVWITQIYVRP